MKTIPEILTEYRSIMIAAGPLARFSKSEVLYELEKELDSRASLLLDAVIVSPNAVGEWTSSIKELTIYSAFRALHPKSASLF